MNTKSTLLVALLIPGMALLAACNRNTTPATDTAASAPAAMSEPAPADTMPAATMPADNMGAMAGAGDNMSFAEMDKNKDGGISHDELATTDMLDQHFSVADTDGNGMLSDAEVIKHRTDMAAAPAK